MLTAMTGFFLWVNLERKKADTFSIYYFHDTYFRRRGVFYIERKEVFEAIELERERQEQLHPMPTRKSCEDADVNAVTAMLYHNEMIAVLTEEFLEVVRALQGEGNLQEELVHTASVCVRWLENLK